MARNRQKGRIAGEPKPKKGVAQTRWMLAFLALLALAIQNFVVQTHLHIPQSRGAAQSVSLITLAAGAFDTAHDASASAPRDRFPITEDPSNCPLCQEVAHSGQFVSSASAHAALPSFVNVNVIVAAEFPPLADPVSHIWRGRAPPIA